MSSIIKVNTYQDANGNALFSSDGSGNVTTSASGMQNTPYFYGDLLSGEQSSVPRNAFTKVTNFGNTIDSHSAFSGGTFTVPSGHGGKYFITGQVDCYYFDAGSDGYYSIAKIYINGTGKNFGFHEANSSQVTRDTPTASGIFNLSAGDTVELYGLMIDISASGTLKFQGGTTFYGYKMIGA